MELGRWVSDDLHPLNWYLPNNIGRLHYMTAFINDVIEYVTFDVGSVRHEINTQTGQLCLVDNETMSNDFKLIPINLLKFIYSFTS